MDKRKIFVIRFKKVYRRLFISEYSYIADSVIINTLKKLSETHNFKLISVNLSNGSLYPSVIKIKCYSYDMPNILYDFANKLGDDIKEINYRKRLF